MTGRTLHLSLMAVVVLAIAFTVSAAVAAPTGAAQGCVRHVRLAHGEALINQCNVCVTVGVTRTRRGIPTPDVHEFTVQARGSLALPFKGPGRTTVGSTFPCNQANLAKPETLASEPQKKCMSLHTDKKIGAVYLVNDCRECRTGTLVRFTATGKDMGKDAMSIRANSFVPIPPRGAAHVILIGEQACPLQRGATR